MLNLVEHPCKSCGLLEIVDADGKCGSCSPEVFRAARLAKQKMVKDWLDIAGLQYVSYDRRLEDARACELYRRPDFLFDCGTHFAVLEVDEHQHKGVSCEVARMVNITGALGLPTVFVRLNPDGYRPAGGAGRQASKNKRRDELLRVLRYHMEELRSACGDSDTGAWVTELYYDGDDPATHGQLRAVLRCE